MINKVERFLPNLNDMERCTVSHKALKLYESLGLRIKMIHRGISFIEKPWMRDYSKFNTKLHARHA